MGSLTDHIDAGLFVQLELRSAEGSVDQEGVINLGWHEAGMKRND